MPALNPTLVTDGTPATAAALNANVEELDLINGELGAVNLDAAFELSKDKIRKGSFTRHGFASALVAQRFDVSVPGADVDLLDGESVFLAGQMCRLDLPPGAWDILVSFTPSEVYDRVVHRFDGGAWFDIDFANSMLSGTFMLQYIYSAFPRVVEIGVRYVTASPTLDSGGGAFFGLVNVFSGHYIAATAFRDP